MVLNIIIKNNKKLSYTLVMKVLNFRNGIIKLIPVKCFMKANKLINYNFFFAQPTKYRNYIKKMNQITEYFHHDTTFMLTLSHDSYSLQPCIE